MARKQTMKFKRGDATTKYLHMPAASWSASGSLYFAAKPAVDNDATDAAAIINKTFTDADIVDSSDPFYQEGKVTYQLAFIPSDIGSVTYADGADKKKYLGEFQFVPSGGEPVSFPGDDNYIEVIIYADIKLAES